MWWELRSAELSADKYVLTLDKKILTECLSLTMAGTLFQGGEEEAD